MSQSNVFLETSVNRDPALFHPEAGEMFIKLERRLQELYREAYTRVHWKIFEGWRHPYRQNYLLLTKKTTRVGPFFSAHQFGLAVDFAGYIEQSKTFTWAIKSHEWGLLKQEAQRAGLQVPITWDPGHVQHPLWPMVFESMQFERPAILDS